MVAHSAIDHTGITGVGGAATFVGCVAKRTTDQTAIVTATDTAVLFTGTDELDTDAFHDPSTNPSRITIPSGRAGTYLLEAYVLWDGNLTGQRRVAFYKNGVALPGSVNSLGSVAGGLGYQQHKTTYICALAAADYVEVYVTQNSGANRSMNGATVPLRFSAVFLGT